MIDLVDFLSSLFLATLLIFIACEIFGYCICFGEEKFIDPVVRMSRLGVLNYDSPFIKNAGYSLVDFRTQKNIEN